ncbi:MAG: UDP-3-O-(3-hydroxymyristoyl)glucosamine N-acyltransferase [Rhodospirillaceae bacterium]|nr:UDP-3-O-(3-hydroxymyristoyl)glucosamine N-acyltransferase [Rhodospirillaceae bacterium]MBT6138550.1 UDP-3-O-(3-hydroxymyristoyl)glucosamine N-acyltransferase [Rhodospirillaceae bacterium]
MADPNFFKKAGPYTLTQLAEMVGAKLVRCLDPDRIISDVATLDQAGADAICFLENRKYIADLENSSAGACLLREDMVDRAPETIALLVCERPRRAFARLAAAFYPQPALEGKIEEGAQVDASAELGEGCRIGANAVIGEGVKLGPRVVVDAGAVIAAAVTVGADSVIGAAASLSHCQIGERVVIYPGARIGQPGFGFEFDDQGPVKMPQLGRVIIEDDVEIGANTTIDRGSGPDTVIGRGTMIDNLVQIGHNVRIGRGCIIVAQVGIAGSTTIGDHVVLGGQVGVVGHLTIGDGVRVAAQSGINRSIKAGLTVGGAPAVAIEEWRRQVVAVKRLGRPAKKKSD